jgi:hypothetical protein
MENKLPSPALQLVLASLIKQGYAGRQRRREELSTSSEALEHLWLEFLKMKDVKESINKRDTEQKGRNS